MKPKVEIAEMIAELKPCTGVEWIKNYYRYCLAPEDTLRDSMLEQLVARQNQQLMFLRARRKFESYQLNQAYELCFAILQRDFFHFETMLIFAEILVERRHASELFSACTSYAENYPEHFMTFHLFGMYYYLLAKFDTARKYFNKAIQLNKASLKSWVMLGHAFAQQEESEQAMNIYRSCIRHFPSSHLPHLFLGMEYTRTNSLKTALLSYKQAMDFTGPDPIIYNEIGCIYLKEKRYVEAKNAFTMALQNCSTDGISWLKHTILNNLGNVQRKFKEYALAIDCYEQSLALCPNDPAVLFSLAFTCQLVGNLHKAILLYHKVVCMKHEIHFVNMMLTNCLEDISNNEEGEAFEN